MRCGAIRTLPEELREEAAREIFERLALWGPNVAAVYPRAEQRGCSAWQRRRARTWYWSGREDSTRRVPSSGSLRLSR